MTDRNLVKLAYSTIDILQKRGYMAGVAWGASEIGIVVKINNQMLELPIKIDNLQTPEMLANSIEQYLIKIN